MTHHARELQLWATHLLPHSIARQVRSAAFAELAPLDPWPSLFLEALEQYMTRGDYCSECGEAKVNGKLVDFGIGHYECHGMVGIDVQWQWVSTCCRAPIYKDPQLTKELLPPDYDDGPDDFDYDFTPDR